MGFGMLALASCMGAGMDFADDALGHRQGKTKTISKNEREKRKARKKAAKQSKRKNRK